MKALLCFSTGFLLTLSLSARSQQTGNLLLIAGGGTPPDGLGDHGPATEASLRYANGLAIDKAGNLFISEGDRHRVRKVNTEGIITTYAGTTLSGYSGDGGNAVEATLRVPRGLDINNDDELFIADSENFVLRKVNIEGIISTSIGCRVNCNSWQIQTFNAMGISIDRDGHIIIGSWCRGVLKGSKDGSLEEIVTTDQADGCVSGVTADSNGDLYFASETSHKVLKRDGKGIVTTVAGNGLNGYSGDHRSAITAALNTPVDVAVNSKGVVFIADLNNQRIRQVTPDGVISTLLITPEAPTALIVDKRNDDLIFSTYTKVYRFTLQEVVQPVLRITKVADVHVLDPSPSDLLLPSSVDPAEIPIEIEGTGIAEGTTIVLQKDGKEVTRGTLSRGKVTLLVSLNPNPAIGPLAVSELRATAMVPLTPTVKNQLPQVKGIDLVGVEVSSSSGQRREQRYVSREGRRYTFAALRARARG